MYGLVVMPIKITNDTLALISSAVVLNQSLSWLSKLITMLSSAYLLVCSAMCWNSSSGKNLRKISSVVLDASKSGRKPKTAREKILLFPYYIWSWNRNCFCAFSHARRTWVVTITWIRTCRKIRVRRLLFGLTWNVITAWWSTCRCHDLM